MEPQISRHSPESASAAPFPTSRASKFLADLPSRGLFTSPVPSSNLGRMRVYVCVHDTAPPADQLIKTNTTNILIRALQLNKKKGELKDASAKLGPEFTKGKRTAVRALDDKIPVKRANTAVAGISGQGPSEASLQSYTVERLRAILREKRLPTKGRKEELIARLTQEDV